MLLALVVLLVVSGLGIGGYMIFLQPKGPGGLAPALSTAQTTLLYQDSLTQDTHIWECQGSATICSFRSDGYHLTQTTSAPSFFESDLTTHRFTDMVIEVSGLFAAANAQVPALGIVFRQQENNRLEEYAFWIDPYGDYALSKYDAQGQPTSVIDLVQSSELNTGLNKMNRLRIIVQGSLFTIFVNGQQLTPPTSDTTYTSGYIGLAVQGTGTEAVFSNLTVTKA